MLSKEILPNNFENTFDIFAHKLSNSYIDICTPFLERLLNWLSEKASYEEIYQFTAKTNSLNHLLHIFKHKTSKNISVKITNLKILAFLSNEEFFYEKIFEKSENIDDIILLLLENMIMDHIEISTISANIMINFYEKCEKIRKHIENCLRFNKNQTSFYELLTNLLSKTTNFSIIEYTLIFINTIIHFKSNINSKIIFKTEFKTSGINEAFIVKKIIIYLKIIFRILHTYIKNI